MYEDSSEEQKVQSKTIEINNKNKEKSQQQNQKGLKLKINTSKSKHDLKLLKMIIQQNEWVEVLKDGDVLWCGSHLFNQQIDIATEIFVNHIPAMSQLCQKKTMGLILNKFRQYWPDQFSFYPKTYLIPENQQQFRIQVLGQKNEKNQKEKDSKNKNKNKKESKSSSENGSQSQSQSDFEEKEEKETNEQFYIAKPSLGANGDGVTLIKNLNDIPKIGKTEWIVQPYIENVLLLQKKKFDLRLYVLISSIDPYICYLNQQGLARFCCQDYQKPSKQNIKNSYIHLTNYSINKNHPNFVNGQTAFSRGSKRCLKTLWQDLSSKGIDTSKIKTNIIEVIQKFLTGLYPFLKYYYQGNYPKKSGKTFQIIGIDILLDEQLNVWFLQANSHPSFLINHLNQKSQVDQCIKKSVVGDAIKISCTEIQNQQQLGVEQCLHSYKKILDNESDQLGEFDLIQNMLKLFHSQCSIRSKWVLSSSQFINFSKLEGMTNEKITKTDYHLIFIKIMRNKLIPTQMTFQDFIEAIEYIVKEIVGYSEEDKLEVMNTHLNHLVQQLS